MKNTKRTIALILAAAFALSLMLTACNKSGENPTGDNSTPGTSSTPGTTSAPSGNNNGTGKKPTWADPSKYDTEKKTWVDEQVAGFKSRYGIDIDAVITEACEEYGQFFNEHITPEAIRTAIVSVAGSGSNVDLTNILSEISNNALNKVNDFLKTKGLNPIDTKEPKQGVAAFGIAATIYYDPDFDPMIKCNLAAAFSRAFLGTGEIESGVASIFDNNYYVQPE